MPSTMQDNTGDRPEDVKPETVDESNEQVHDPAEDYKVEGLDTDNVHHDEEDVPAALERETDDGKGGAVVPKADFDSYTEPDADKEDNS
jgi:hypothetical protein